MNVMGEKEPHAISIANGRSLYTLLLHMVACNDAITIMVMRVMMTMITVNEAWLTAFHQWILVMMMLMITIDAAVGMIMIVGEWHTC